MLYRQIFSALVPWLFILPGCLIAEVHAQDIETITITANSVGGDSISDVNLTTYNGFATVIDRSSFEHRFVELTNLLNEQPSIQTLTTGGTGSDSSASIRGSTGKQVNVFVDGILLSSALSGSANLAMIPSSIIEAIEIYPDYTPVQLSDANLAGAINIRSRSPHHLSGNGGKVGISYGSYGTKQADASYWGGSHDTHVIAAASTTKADNDYHVNYDLFPNLTAGTSHSRQNNAFERADGFTRIRHDINDSLILQTMLNYTNSENEIPTIQNKSGPAATFHNDSQRASIGLESAYDNHNWGTRLYGNRTNNTFKDIFQSIALQPQHIEQQEDTFGGNVYYEGDVSHHTLTASIDGSDTTINKENHLGLRDSIDARRKKLTTAFSDVWQIIDSVSVYNLIRGYHIEDNTDAGTSSFSAGCASNNARCLSSKHNEISFQTGFSFSFARYWKIKSNIGRLLRIPTLAEKYGELGNYIGDPDLQPETSKSFDSGILFSNKSFSSELVAYYRHIDDGIYVAYDARGVGHPSNISSSEIKGIEFSGHWSINDAFSLDMSGYAMDSENLSAIKANKGKKLHGIYHNGYRASFTWCNTHQSIVTSYQADNDLYYTPSNSVKADDKTSLDVSYTYWLKHWSFNAGISNLLNKQYSDYNRMPAMGRFYNASIHYEF